MSLEVINSAAPEGKQKTIIVFGLGRGGTSALAGVTEADGDGDAGGSHASIET